MNLSEEIKSLIKELQSLKEAYGNNMIQEAISPVATSAYANSKLPIQNSPAQPMQSAQPINAANKIQSPQIRPKPEPKVKQVNFNTGKENAFSAIFSERGFSIGGTRMSFEFLEDALSKRSTITLDNGKGPTLDAVNMNKILKYKDLY